MTTPKILVTGATGTIGAPLVRELRARGAEFAVMTSRAEATAIAKIAGPNVRRGRFDDPASLADAFEGVATLFVLLPLVPHKRDLARNVAAAARAAGVRHIVRSSGAGADSASPFALPRLQGEIDDIFVATGIACTFLQPATFMQNYVNFYADMVRDGHIVAATADAPQAMVDVRDIAAAAAQVLLHPHDHAGRAYHLTGSEALTDSQRAAVFSKVLARSFGFAAVPVEAADQGMRDAGYPDALVEWMGSLNRIVSAGHAAATSDDVQRLTGRAPILFRDFVRDHASRWQAAVTA